MTRGGSGFVRISVVVDGVAQPDESPLKRSVATSVATFQRTARVVFGLGCPRAPVRTG